MRLLKCLLLVIGAFFLLSEMKPSDILAKDDFPTKHLVIVNGYGPGGSVDIEIRGIIPYVEKQLGKGIIVQNVTGASGLLAYNMVSSAKPDGYTLLVAGFPTPTLVQKFYGDRAKYDAREYSHIFAFAIRRIVLVGNPEVYKSFEDFIKAGAHKRLMLGVVGRGTPTHLAGVMLQDMIRMKLNIIPFDSGGEGVAALAGKHVDAVVTIASTAIGLAQSGVVKGILAIGESRIPGYPDTPSAKELGYDVAMQIPYVNGVVGPPKMPQDRIEILEAAFANAIKQPEYVKYCKARDLEILSLPRAAFHKETIRAHQAVDKYLEMLKK